MGGTLRNLTPEACWWPHTKPAPHSSPPATQHPMGDVEGINEGRGPQQRQGKPVSVGRVGPFSGAGTHKATYAHRPSKHLSPPGIESRVNMSMPRLVITGHRVGLHLAMASQPLSHPAPGTSSGPPPGWSLVIWHCGPQVLGLFERACTRVRHAKKISTSSEPQPAACDRCAASWQPGLTLSAPSGPPSGRPHMAMSTAAFGGLRRGGQPDRQFRASLHSLISQSSQGPHESEGPQTPP